MSLQHRVILKGQPILAVLNNCIFTPSARALDVFQILRFIQMVCMLHVLKLSMIPALCYVLLTTSSALYLHCSVLFVMFHRQTLVSRLWPDPSRFYRAALRWIFCPNAATIQEDALSAEKMVRCGATVSQSEPAVL